MSTPVLLNLLNKLGKSDKKLSILSLFHNKLNKFNNTGACIHVRFYLHMTFKFSFWA